MVVIVHIGKTRENDESLRRAVESVVNCFALGAPDFQGASIGHVIHGGGAAAVYQSTRHCPN